MTLLPGYFSRAQQLIPPLVRAMHPPPGQPATRGGAEPGTDQQRREARPVPSDRGVSAETLGRVIGMLRRVAGGEAGGDALAAEARQVLSLLGAQPPQPAESRRARLNVVA